MCLPCRTCAIHVPLLPAQSIWLARRKRLQLFSSFLYYFSLSYLDWPSTGAEVGRFEHFVYLFLALVCKVFFSVFLGQNFGCFLFLRTQLPYLSLNVS